MATANLNTKQVMALAGVSHMAVYQWRQGSEKRDPLPTVAGETPRSVAFKPRDLKAWAKRCGIELVADPVAVASGEVVLELPKKAVKTAKKAAKKAGTAKATKKRTRH